MTSTIRVTSKRFRRIAPELPESVRKQVLEAANETARFGLTAVQRTISKTKPPPVATGNYRAAWKIIYNPDGPQLVNTAPYARYVEMGRRPGKRPPLTPIEQWVRVKRLATDPKKIRSIAFAVQDKIGKKGTKGRFIMKRTVPVMRKFYTRQLKASVAYTEPPR